MGKLGTSPPHHLRIEIFSQHLINKIKTHISSTLISDQKIISKGKIEKTKERYAEVGNGEVPKMTFLYIFMIFMNKIFLFVSETLLLLFVCDSHISRPIIASETKSQLLFQMKILYSAISSQQGFP